MTPEDRIKQLRSDATPTEAEWQEFRSVAHRSLARRRMAAVAGSLGLAVAIVVGGYAVANMDTGEQRGPGIAGTPTPSVTDDTDNPTPDPSETQSPETPLDPTEREVPMPLNQWYVETDGKLTPFIYFLNEPVSPRRLLEQTIDFVPGPLGETGGDTAIPDDNRLISLGFVGSTAEVVMQGTVPSEEQDLRMAQAQIVYTATQFDGIEEVDLTWEDRKSPGLTREDFHDLLPPIAVEVPGGAGVSERTFRLSGIANVYEATVTWRLTDEDGGLLKEGFTTATCGTGCWGTFSTKITYEGPEEQVTLQVFQSSAEDGSPMNMVEIPVFFEES
jgi:hypothetical protein